MNITATAPEAVVWVAPQRVKLVEQLLDAMGSSVHPIGLGGPRHTHIDQLSSALGCPRYDDLRKLLVDRPSAYVLLANVAAVSDDDLLTALQQGSIVINLEPHAAELVELLSLQQRLKLRSSDGLLLAERVVMAPAFMQSPGMLRAADPHEVLGDKRLIALNNIGRSCDATLFARLFDAWLTVLHFADLPETIDASLIGSGAGTTDDLRQVTGQFAAHARMLDGHAAVLAVSDRGGAHRRGLHVIGSDGELRATDTAYELYRSTGDMVDNAPDSETPRTFADLVAAQWRRLLDRTVEDGSGSGISGMQPPHDERHAKAMACCQTCLLSARTGEEENPRKMLEMVR